MKIFMKVLLIIISVLVVIFIVGSIFSNLLFPPPLSQEATKNDFINNHDNIMIVTDYLINSKYEKMVIYDTDDGKTMFASGHGDISINDPRVVIAINQLFKNGYEVINKSKNTIYLQRSTKFRSFGSGIAYSIDGTTEPKLQFLTLLEPLSIENWYYYEEDVIEWEKIHKYE